MTFDQLVQKAQTGQWQMAEAAFLVQDEAQYGDGSLARFAEELEISYGHARKIAEAWKRRSENARLARTSQSAVMELASVPDEKLDEVLDSIEAENNGNVPKAAARKAAEPYREKKQKTRAQIVKDATDKAGKILGNVLREAEELHGLLPDVEFGDQMRESFLDDLERIESILADVRTGVTGLDFDSFGGGVPSVEEAA